MGRSVWRGLVAVVAIAGAAFPGAGASAETAAGQVDLAFGSCGVAESVPMDMVGRGLPGAAHSVAVQSDGKLLLAGAAENKHTLTRLSPDGAVDHSFGRSGTVLGAGVGWALVVVQPDQRIVVTGHRSGTVDSVRRHLPDGALDRSFGQGGIAPLPSGTALRAVTLQADGKILGLSESSLVRLLPNDAVDPSFGTGARCRRCRGG